MPVVPGEGVVARGRRRRVRVDPVLVDDAAEAVEAGVLVAALAGREVRQVDANLGWARVSSTSEDDPSSPSRVGNRACPLPIPSVRTDDPSSVTSINGIAV